MQNGNEDNVNGAGNGAGTSNDVSNDNTKNGSGTDVPLVAGASAAGGVAAVVGAGMLLRKRRNRKRNVELGDGWHREGKREGDQSVPAMSNPMHECEMISIRSDAIDNPVRQSGNLNGTPESDVL